MPLALHTGSQRLVVNVFSMSALTAVLRRRGSEATVREGWVATMLQQHKDVETWNTPDTHNLRSLAQALGPEHEAKVMACLGVRASHDGTMEVSDMHQELGRECTGLPPLVLQSALVRRPPCPSALLPALACPAPSGDVNMVRARGKAAQTISGDGNR